MYSINGLMHSDMYLGKDYSKGMKHWKYIKRYKVNGKWRYVYGDDKTHDKVVQKMRIIDSYKKELIRTEKNANYLNKEMDQDLSNGKSISSYEKDNLKSEVERKKELNESIKNKTKEIEKHTISDITKKYAEKGKKFISNLFTVKTKYKMSSNLKP